MPTKKKSDGGVRSRKTYIESRHRLKSGALTASERSYIAEHIHEDPEAIASKLQRSLRIVTDELTRLTGETSGPRGGMPLESQLKRRPEWNQFKKQFSDEELREFEHQYVQIMSQMRDDVLPTEELQVFQVITLKIQIDRVLAEQRRALDTIDRNFGAKGQDERAQYDAAVRTNSACAELYKTYSDKQDKLLAALKATRDQRVKILESSKQTWIGLIRAAMEEDRRREMGEEAGLMLVAAQHERARLAAPHTYADGTVDQPLLTPETLFSEAEEENSTEPSPAYDTSPLGAVEDGADIDAPQQDA